MQPQSNTNSFFGIRISQPGINVQQANPKQLLYQSDYSTETWYDATGNAILNIGNIGTASASSYGLKVLNDSGSTMLEAGLLPSGSYGINLYDGTSQYSQSGVPQILIGLLPDGTVGIVQSISGTNVNDIFS